MVPTEIEAAFAEGARRALSRRAAPLRRTAAALTTTTTDAAGKPVRIMDPEGVTALGTARLFEECAAVLQLRTGGRFAS